MKKYAYLILAHDNPKVLIFLLSQLDDPRNDIFIHLDSKSNINKNILRVNHSRLFYTISTRCYWGDYSQTNATLLLMKEAIQKGPYHYYHLLSGTTLCTKTKDEICQFFDNTTQEYFHINTGIFKSVQDRCRYYYPFIKTNIYRNSKIIKGLSVFLGKAQKLIGINRLRNSNIYPLYGGMEWFSITDDFVRYVLSLEPLIYSTFHRTLASEEVFVQTIAIHSAFRKRVYGYNGKDDFVDACKIYQFWNNGKSSYIDTGEKMEIAKNDIRSFFARKFKDEDIEMIKEVFKDTIV